MRSTNWILIVLTSVLVSACAGRHRPITPPPTPTATKEQPSLATLTAGCEALQTQGYPIQCSTRFYEGVLIMTAHFEEQNALDKYHATLEQNVALPFCAAAGRSGQRASVLEELGSKRFRVLACATEQWTQWQEPTTVTRQHTCDSVNAARDLPIHCRVDHANGMFTMSIKFTKEADLEHHIRPMLENVAEPFCKAVVARGDGGLVKLQRASDMAVAVFNCETGKLGTWQTPPPPAPAAPTQTTTQQRSSVTTL